MTADPRGYYRDTDDAIRRTTLLDRFAAKVARAFEAVENRLDDSINRHLELAIPEPRKSTSPDNVLALHRDGVERVGTHPCCDCCAHQCDDLHRDPCDVHQGGAFA